MLIADKGRCQDQKGWQMLLTHILFSLVCYFFDARNGTQGLVHGRQVLTTDLYLQLLI